MENGKMIWGMGKVTNLNKSIGTQYYNNGDRYNGQWKDDMRVGKGKSTH